MFVENRALISVYFGLSNLISNRVLVERESFLDDFNNINSEIQRAFRDNNLEFSFNTIKYWSEIVSFGHENTINHFSINIH